MEFDIRSLLKGALALMWGELGFFFSLGVLFYAGGAVTGLTRRQLRGIGYAVLCVIMFIQLLRIFLGRAAENRLKALADVGGAVAALAAAILVHAANPASDAVYYAAAVFVIGGVLWTLLALIRLYNHMATHPDPHFFEPEKKKKKRAPAAAALILAAGIAAAAAAGTAEAAVLPAGTAYAMPPGAQATPGSAPDRGRDDPDGIVYRNPQTGFAVRITDDAGLLASDGLRELAAAMIPVTEFGNAGFYTKTDRLDTEREIRRVYRTWFGTESGTVFMIDMGNRSIWIHSDGEVYRVITKEWADVITDNVYRLASAGRYGDCAVSAFEQILTRLNGGKVNNGLKIGTSLLLSVLVSMLVNYLLILRMRNKRSVTDTLAPLLGAAAIFALTGAQKVKRGSRRIYRPRVSSGGGGGFSGGGFSGGGFSGGGFSGGGGGFSGGGGGFSGGGGGHGF